MLDALCRLLKFSPKVPSIKALQLEASSVCQLSCLYCPRTQTAGWPNQFMPWDLYKERIVPYFNYFEMIFLQGWGEPLTNPYFWDMVKLAKHANRKVGFTTNGVLFDDEAADLACDIGIDLISFTFAGANAATHEFYRSGACFNDLSDTIRMLANKKIVRKTDKPSIGIYFTMMRDNLHEFPHVVEQALTLGANQVTASHMDCIPNRDAEKHAVFLNPMPDDLKYISKAAQLAHASGLPFKAEPPLLTGEILACEPNPLRVTLFIRADGTVVPCHQMALPPKAIRELFFHGAPYEYQPLLLGDVYQDTLPDILSNTDSQSIYNTFVSRAEFAASCGLKIPDVPDMCKKCYKLYGA